MYLLIIALPMLGKHYRSYLASSSIPLRLIALYLFILVPYTGIAQKDSSFSRFIQPATAFNSQRFYGLAASEMAVGAGSLIALNTLWYNNYPRSAFHLFNDAGEWLQMDKAGHCLTAYYLGSIGNDLFLWTGINAHKAILYGGLLGFMYQNAIEVLDGFSTQWGFSAPDFAANSLGAGMLIAQQLAWKEQRIILKYSYHTTIYAPYRPALLGNRISETWLKDYNGQTYWLSVNIASFLKQRQSLVPWLNVAFGYGAEGMLGANGNPMVNENGKAYPYFDRFRKVYLSLDIDLKRIKTRSPLLKTIFTALNFIKIPAPAIEWNKGGVKGRLLYF